MGGLFDRSKILAQLHKWQERLLDLTRANPLLGLNRSRVSKLRVTEPCDVDLFGNFALADEPVLRMPLVRRAPSTVLRETEEVQDQTPQLRIEPGDVAFDAAPIDLMRRLRRIYDNAHTTVEERGVTTLYLTFGILSWRDESLGESTSPLWMVPCEFASSGPTTALRLKRADEEMQLNPALELYLRERHKVTLPTLPEEPEPGSLSQFLEDMRKIVQEQGWEVTNEVWLSTYTFESLVIYQDLKAMADAAVANPIVAALARASTGTDVSERLGDDLDALPAPKIVPLPVLPTDSSQLEALTYAASGRNLVIHGPPGTGKSQTISNFIADALGRNQKVLFVSAKMAALNVVYQRLAEKGLGRFCLEAHSTKAGKMKIIDELRRTLQAETEANGNHLSDELEALIRIRRQLNGYVQDLHRKIEPLGLTLYQAIGKVAKLQEAPDLRFSLPWHDPHSVTRAELDEALDALADLSAQATVFDARAQHPWRGFTSTATGVGLQQSVESDLHGITEMVRMIQRAYESLQDLLPLGEGLSLAGIQSHGPLLQALTEVERLPSGWWKSTAGHLNETASMLEDAGERAEELAAKRPQYRAILDRPFAEGRVLLLPAEARFRAWYRRMTPSYLRWRSAVRQHLKPGAKTDFRSLRHYYLLATRLAGIDAWLEEHHEHLIAEVGAPGVRDVDVLRRVARQFRTAALLHASLSAKGIRPAERPTAVSREMREAAAKVLASFPSRRAAFAEAITRSDSAWPDGFVDGLAVSQARLSALIERCEAVLTTPQKVHEWLLLQRTVEHCRRLGLGPLIDALGDISGRLARSALERHFFTLWVDAVIQRSEHLATFSGARREEHIQKFRNLDERIRGLTIRRIQAVAFGPARRIQEARDDLGGRGEVGVLRYELGKKRRIKPLRRLFAEIPHVLQALKPCILMSPISVSTYLKPGALEFDLVVFDEASQLPTAETIPSILRAKQVVVAGDPNQLPPTSFFAASLLADEELYDEDEQAQEPLDSLLDDCVAIVPTFQEVYLRWHYRSRDERLIKFSNHYIYDNRLITFPSPSTSDEGRGVRLVYVPDGVWDRGKSRTNRREARRVAELVVEHLEQHPERSLGVVAMNVQQREAIEDAISEQLLERPDLAPRLSANRLEPFFVKSLENVQGDERDTMIISVGYGKDADGALTFNFGPLNMEGGWRRLNVLVTRAKWQTILITSLHSYELHGVNPQNRGAVTLKNYIEYAERRADLPHEPPTVTDAETNDFEDAIRQALVERGLVVDQQVGASKYRIDLAIRDRRDPTRYVLGVEFDGATYHSARTVRDRDLLRQLVLRDMQWRLHRVWSTDWFRDPERELQAILKGLERAEAVPPEKLPEAPPRSAPAAPTQPTPSGRAEPRPEPPRRYLPGEPYRKYRTQQRSGNRNAMLYGWNVSVLADDVAAIVDMEGPVHEELIADRLKELHGVERLGSNVQANISRAIELAIRKHGLYRARDARFICKEGKTLRTFRVPGDGVKRPINLITPEEIELAVLYLVEDQFGMSRDQIPQAIVKIFGFDRARAEGADIIRSVVDGLVDQGALRSSGYQVYLP